MFKEIQQAYSVLSDKNKRKIYDEENGLVYFIKFFIFQESLAIYMKKKNLGKITIKCQKKLI